MNSDYQVTQGHRRHEMSGHGDAEFRNEHSVAKVLNDFPPLSLLVHTVNREIHRFWCKRGKQLPHDAMNSLVQEYAERVKSVLHDATFADAQAEEQLKEPVMRLVEAFGTTIGKPLSARPEARVQEFEVRPDLGVLSDSLLVGHIELKAAGKGARPDRLRGRDKEQWERLKGHPNLIYTDGSEWGLYRYGERVDYLRPQGSAPDDGAEAFSTRDVENLDSLLKNFVDWEPIVPSTPKALAEMLAPICRLVRGEVLDALSNPESHLTSLASDWREVLFPNADDSQFADAYAQTLTYALLLARFEGETDLRIGVAAESLRAGHALLSQALYSLADPEARAEIGLGVELLQRVVQAVQPERLSRGKQDPWLYFYEDFLAAYDPKLRKDRGVYYTPVEVVACQTRLVSHLLRHKFQKDLAFASDGVTFLDPAVGTGTYPLAAVEHSLALAEEKYGVGSRPATASVLAKNMHGFEILVGPYSVAHLRLTQGIVAAQGQIPADGVHVYLTDTLESPNVTPEEWHVAFGVQLSAEHRKAQVVKRDTPVMVCVGNPPYDRQTIDPNDQNQVNRKGGWVRFGDNTNPEPILRDFITPLSAEDGVHAKNLYNDYVYFWRWALWKVFEYNESKTGIVSFITAASYLRGPGFKGMRQVMRQTFDELWIIDLEGGSLGARKTENVFNIQNPVAIAIGVKYDKEPTGLPAKVRYARITGTREEKLSVLDGIGNFSDLAWQDCSDGWQDSFSPVGEGDFFGYPLLTEILPWQHSGVQTKRPWVIGETKEVLSERWSALVSLLPEERKTAMVETGQTGRNTEGSYPSFTNGSVRLPPLAGVTRATALPEVVRYGYRFLDRQHLIADGRLIDRPRPQLWDAYGEKQIHLTTLTGTPLGDGSAVGVTDLVPDLHYFRGSYGGKDVIPLWRDAQAHTPNIGAGALAAIQGVLGEVKPEDLFAYIYALLSSPSYVARFSEELLYSSPRVPITKNIELFKKVVGQGRKLVHLHTYGNRLAPDNQRQGVVPRGSARCTTAISETEELYPEEISYDADTHTLTFGTGAFAPVSEEMWNYSLSGYHVIEGWLKNRRRTGCGRKSSPLDDIRPKRWTAEMTTELLELLWVVEQTIRVFPELESALNEVVAAECFQIDELPAPTDTERSAPARGQHEQQTLGL